jgi:hypothetical protein
VQQHLALVVIVGFYSRGHWQLCVTRVLCLLVFSFISLAGMCLVKGFWLICLITKWMCVSIKNGLCPLGVCQVLQHCCSAMLQQCGAVYIGYAEGGFCSCVSPTRAFAHHVFNHVRHPQPWLPVPLESVPMLELSSKHVSAGC